VKYYICTGYRSRFFRWGRGGEGRGSFFWGGKGTSLENFLGWRNIFGREEGGIQTKRNYDTDDEKGASKKLQRNLKLKRYLQK